MDRVLYKKIWGKISEYKNMIFISGPRQAGKTTLSKSISDDFTNFYYYNYDIIDEKRKVIEDPLFYEKLNRKDDSIPLIIFDELHKYYDWKNYLKSVYDRDGKNYKIIVSGSGRLDIYEKGGDSLAGRYFGFHLWPFTLSELAENNINFDEFINNPVGIYKVKNHIRSIWEDLEEFSGFPEPFLKKSKQYYRIWSNTYKKQLLREDIRDITHIRNIEKVELLFSMLSSRIGSPLSMSNLANDIKVSFDSVKGWIHIFERFFLIFLLSPWHRKISRSITKEKKVYFFDYAGIQSQAARIENMAALEIYRAVNNWNNLGLGDFSLHYIRNREKQEVDFLIVNNSKPFLLIEIKLSDTTPSKSLRKFQKQLKIPAVQLVNKPGVYKTFSYNDFKIIVVSIDHWLSILP